MSNFDLNVSDVPPHIFGIANVTSKRHNMQAENRAAQSKSGTESSSSASSSSSESESESASDAKPPAPKSLFESDNSDDAGKMKDETHLTDTEEEGDTTEEDEQMQTKQVSRRETLNEIKKSMASMPDVYGVRRSERSRKEPTRYTECASDSDSDRPRGRRRGQRKISNDAWGGSEESSEESTESESYKPARQPTKRSVPVRTKKGRGRPPARRRRAPSYSDSEEDMVKRMTSRRATRTGISYKDESESATDPDDVIEQTEEQVREQEEVESRETIERVLEHRIGYRHAVGSKTTLYNVEDNGNPNKPLFENSDTKPDLVQQYLIKWKGWSYLHCTWESHSTLDKKVNGMKKLDNYKKRQEEIDNWKESATPEEVEYFDCQNEMMSDLLQHYLLADRVIDHKSQKGLTHPDYYLKWQGLPYSECTWESGDLISKRFSSQVDDYHARNKSQTTPSKLCKALKVRPKFQQLPSQPDYIGEHGTYELRDYQLDGLNWLIQSWCKYNSVILADEMGLGKTIQIISFLSYLANEYQLYGPFLIIVPLSTIVAWQREFGIWAPEMNVVTYLGDMTSRSMIRQYEFYQPGNKRIKFNALITTYEIILKDKAHLCGFNWAMLIVDEAHRLKNDDSLLYRCLMDFNSNHRVLVTGTPLQNSLRELWSLLHFIMPDKFDSWDEFEEAHSNTTSENQGFSALHKELQPFLLRRVKKDVEKSLPAKVEQILRVEMSSIQKQYTRWILAKNYKALSKGLKGSIVGFINIMMELKKCCNHAFITRPQLQRCPTSSEQLQVLLRGSGKMLLLEKLLVRLKETGHRVLIFSQMVRMLDIIADYLTLKQFQFQRLDGSIRGDLRKQALDHFNADGSQDFCFLLSTRAGGLGVNLATADTVIIFDSDWNPQNDLQAQARAHRIGQKNQVSVYRLVCKNSVEETIVERAKRKMVLDHLIIQRMDTTGRTILNRDKSSNNTPFNKEELSSILKFGAEDLFKGTDGEDEEPQVDIDEILLRAETRDMETSSGGDDLLSNFKVVSFDNLEEAEDKRQLAIDEDSVDKEWDSIIPEATRQKVDEEEKQKQMVDLHLPPRSRKTIQQLEKEYDSDGAKRSRRRDDEDVDSGSSEDDEDDRPKRRAKQRGNKEAGAFTSMEVRKFIKSYKKFSNPLNRLDAIACDAELQEKSEVQLHSLAELIKSRCDECMRTYRQQQQGEEENGEAKKSQRGPTFKIANVTVNAMTLAKTMDDLSPLSYLPKDKDERKRYTMNCHVKHANWDCEWTEEDDTNLIRGVYEYGMGNWEHIKMDPEFHLQQKILPGTATKPQAKHLQTRMEYLLKVLKKVSECGDSDTATKTKKKRAPKSKSYVEESGDVLERNGDTNNAIKEEASNHIADTARKKKKGKQISAEFVESDESDIEENVKGDKEKTHKDKRRKHKDVKHKDKQKNSKTTEALHITAKSKPVPVDETDEAPTLSTKVFNQCKEQMRPVKKALKQLDNPEDGLSEREATKHILNCLLTIGDHIAICLSLLTDPNDIKTLRSNLWIFVSHFTDFEPTKLHKMYKHVLKKRDTTSANDKNATTQKENQVQPERKRKISDDGDKKKADEISHKPRHGHKDRSEHKTKNVQEGASKQERTSSVDKSFTKEDKNRLVIIQLI